MNFIKSLNRNLLVIRPFVHDPIKHLLSLIFNKNYRSYAILCLFLASKNRYNPAKIKVNGLNFLAVDVTSFLSAFKSIFVNQIYCFSHKSESAPHILDCGANIGVSVLYFKKLFPDCKIIAYEADPQIFSFLSSNLQLNNVEGVELHNKAIWSSETSLSFKQEGADAGHISSSSHGDITIPTVSLRSLLNNNHFDLVKIDIEGAEYEALKGCSDVLRKAERYFVEYHSFADQKQDLGDLVNLFVNNGFRTHIHTEHFSIQPFIKKHIHYGMDLQLNLYFDKT